MAYRPFSAHRWRIQIKDVSDAIEDLFAFLEDEQVVDKWVDMLRAENEYDDEISDEDVDAAYSDGEVPVLHSPESEGKLDPTIVDGEVTNRAQSEGADEKAPNRNHDANRNSAPPWELRLRFYRFMVRPYTPDEEFYHHKRFTISASKAIILNQWVVLRCTYVELILRDFLEAAFLAHPYKMHDFVGDGQTRKGWVQIKTILESGTKDAILLELASEAASNALRGPMRDQLRHLERVVGKGELPKDLKDSLVLDVDIRNRIVHEKYQLPYEAKWNRRFTNITELLIWLSHLAAQANIPVELPSEGY